VGGDKFSVVWCQRVGLMNWAGGRGDSNRQCYFEGRLSGSEKFLTGAGERNKRNHLYEQSERQKKGEVTKTCN